MDGLAASSYKPLNGMRHAQSLENVSWGASPRKKYWGPLDKDSRNKPNWESFGNENGYDDGENGMGSSDSLHHSGDFGQGQLSQQYDSHGSTDDLVAASVRPFNNNPALPSTQRDIVGNNLHFKSSQRNNDWIEDENDQLAALLLYRDMLKRNLTTAAKAGGGLPRMRHGRVGSQWRHIKQTNTYSGSNLMFVDGTVRIDDTYKYPMPRFGYPPMKRPQHQFSASQNDLSFTSSNPATKSLDAMSWSQNEAYKRRPSASHYSSRVQHPPKESSSHWMNDSTSNKHQSLNHSFNEHDYHEVKSPVQDRTKHSLH